MTPAAVLRQARGEAGLTQAQLARRLGTSQPVVARLESGRSNPTVDTLARALHATGHQLTLGAEPQPPSVDESLIRRHLELTPSQRIEVLEQMVEEGRKFAIAGERARDERP